MAFGVNMPMVPPPITDITDTITARSNGPVNSIATYSSDSTARLSEYFFRFNRLSFIAVLNLARRNSPRLPPL